MTVRDFFRHPLAAAGDVAVKKVVKQLAGKLDLVYFGSVNQHRDEHQLIRGITISPNHVDSHFCVGHFKGHDISLVEHVDTLKFPGRQPERYRWMILQVDLKRSDLPHIFMESGHYGQVFYENLMLKHATFMNAASLFLEHDPMLLKQFRILAPPDKFEDVDQMLTKELTATLAHHFKHFDFEINSDQLIVYALNPVVSTHLLHDMLRVGVWLADQLNAAHIEDRVTPAPRQHHVVGQI